MAETKVKKNTKEKVSKDTDILVSKAVRTVLAGKRQTPAKVKTRAEVSGGGKKPWRQKGTGRARAGSNRSPIWRGGGVTFGPTGNENHKLGINKKEMKAAREAAFNDMKKNTISVNSPGVKKTQEAVKILKDNKVEGKTLVVIAAKGDKAKEAYKAFRNIRDIKVAQAGNENIHDILSVRKILEVKITSQKGAK
ncbi:MAG: 50S ribosomal protein L4 [Patescibacteria group bacterium]|nr:50S ribosomal protein L4 [Patescibacteria group bacterium]